MLEENYLYINRYRKEKLIKKHEKNLFFLMRI